ncbi:hypothetical protein D3C72_1803250 [compost metagenome]
MRVAGVLGQQRGFERGVGQLHVADVDREQVDLAGVEAALVDGVGGDRFGRNVERSGDQGGQRVRRVVEREFEFGDSQHVVGLVVIKQTDDFKRPGRYETCSWIRRAGSLRRRGSARPCRS